MSRNRIVFAAAVVGVLMFFSAFAPSARASVRFQATDTPTPTETPWGGGLGAGTGVYNGYYCGGVQGWTITGDYELSSYDDAGGPGCVDAYKSFFIEAHSGGNLISQDVPVSVLGIYRARVHASAMTGTGSKAWIGFSNCAVPGAAGLQDVPVYPDWSWITVECYIGSIGMYSFRFNRDMFYEERVLFDSAELTLVTTNTPTPGPTPSLQPTWTLNPIIPTSTPWAPPPGTPLPGWQYLDYLDADLWDHRYPSAYHFDYVAAGDPCDGGGYYYYAGEEGAFRVKDVTFPYSGTYRFRVTIWSTDTQKTELGVASNDFPPANLQGYLFAGTGGVCMSEEVSADLNSPGPHELMLACSISDGSISSPCLVSSLRIDYIANAQGTPQPTIYPTPTASPCPLVGCPGPTLNATWVTAWPTLNSTTIPPILIFPTPIVITTSCPQIGPLQIGESEIGVKFCLIEYRYTVQFLWFTLTTDWIVFVLVISAIISWIKYR